MKKKLDAPTFISLVNETCGELPHVENFDAGAFLDGFIGELDFNMERTSEDWSDIIGLMGVILNYHLYMLDRKLRQRKVEEAILKMLKEEGKEGEGLHVMRVQSGEELHRIIEEQLKTEETTPKDTTKH